MVQRKIMSTVMDDKGTWIYKTVMTVLLSWKQKGYDLLQTRRNSIQE